MKIQFTAKMALTLVLALAFSSLRAIDYFVKPTGNNANNGTSYATAFKTIQRALDMAAPGSTIFVEGGTYKERLWWPTSGTAVAPITLTNYSTGIVYVSGAAGGTNSGQNALLALTNISHVRINNVRFHTNYRADAVGIYIGGAGDDIDVTNCRIYNVGWTNSNTAVPSPSQNANPLVVVGTSANALTDVQIRNNQIYNCVTGFSEGLTIVGNVDGFLLENNIVRNITNIGIVCAGHYAWTGAPAAVNFARNGVVRGNTVYSCVSQVAVSAGIYVDGARNMLVERNKSYLNGVGFSVGCENANATAKFVTLRNNLAYNNIDCGMYFGSNAASSSVDSSRVTNNTFFQNFNQGGWGAEVSLQNCANNLFKQNIFVPRTLQCVAVGIWGFTATNFSSEYNLYWRVGGNTADMVANIGAGSNAVYGDPKFISTSLPTPNLHLKTGSKAIQAGDPAFAAAPGELDMDGQARVQVGRVDIGADETALSVQPGPVAEVRSVSPEFLGSDLRAEAFPNPAISQLSVRWPQAVRGTIRLCDLLGKTLIIRELDKVEAAQFSVAEIPAGIYMLVFEPAPGEVLPRSVEKIIVGNK